MTPEELQRQFIDKFREINDVNGFYDFTPYTDGNVGFSVKKDLNASDNNTSLLTFYLPPVPPAEDGKRLMMIDATYGEKRDNGISLRDHNKIKLTSPADLTSRNDYYYDVAGNRLIKKTEEISPIALINEIYDEHIKSTKPFKGLWLRAKILFWRIISKDIFDVFYNISRFLLWLVTGDRYSYEPILQAEILNNEIVNHSMQELVGHRRDRGVKEVIKARPKFEFLGYSASYWVIIFYSIFHLLLYALFEYEDWRPAIITVLLKNNFLTLIYVIVSLWFMEVIIPMILKFLIKKTAALSFAVASRNIKV